MQMFYSPSSNGFYCVAIHGNRIPSDAREVAAEIYAALAGQAVVADANGDPVLYVIEPTQEHRAAQLQQAVQEWLDARAQATGYDDIRAAVTYACEPAVLKFQLEGQAFRAWRSLVWGRCYEIFDQVKRGERDTPTSDALIAELPQFKGA